MWLMRGLRNNLLLPCHQRTAIGEPACLQHVIPVATQQHAEKAHLMIRNGEP